MMPKQSEYKITFNVAKPGRIKLRLAGLALLAFGWLTRIKLKTKSGHRPLPGDNVEPNRRLFQHGPAVGKAQYLEGEMTYRGISEPLAVSKDYPSEVIEWSAGEWKPVVTPVVLESCHGCKRTIFTDKVRGNNTGKPYHAECLIPECRA